jgi:dipeptidyl aminopeptidase/acylaminoacyl peptidase
MGNYGMRLLVALLLAALAQAETWSLERLFTRPFAWGTRPEDMRWSRQGRILLFLWNAEGRRFLDLYAYRAASKKLVRLTDLEGLDDPLNRSAAEKDDRLKANLAPPDGLRAFDVCDDGSLAVFSHRGDLWTVRTDGSAKPFRLTRTRATETSPALSPDGRRIAFARDGQVFVHEIASGQLWQVTEIEAGESGGSLGVFRWSPDGKRLLYSVRMGSGRRLLLPDFSGRLVTASPFPRSLPGDQPVETRTFVVNAEGSVPRQMEAGAWGGKSYSFSTPLWSPDSRRILHSAIHAGLKQCQITVWDADAGKAKIVSDEKDPAWVSRPDLAWSPDSKQVLFTSERDGWNHLYAVAAEGGTPRQITRGAWEVSNERGWGNEPEWAGDFIYYSSTEVDTAERHVHRVRPDGSGKERLTRSEGLHTAYANEDGRDLALMSASLAEPFELYCNGERVTRSLRPEFARYKWPEIRFFDFPSRGDGKTVRGRMTLPAGYPGSGKWPAVIFIHGAGIATSILKQWGAYQEERFVFNSYLANRGYVVLDLDYRGSTGYGRDWRSGVLLHMGGRDLDDVLGLVDYAARPGTIDTKRIGIWGSSYGGFMTGMAMFLAPGTFRAGAAFSAVNDWENYNAFYTEQRLGKPDQHPEAYRRSSPILFSSLLKNPLLIVHGMVDNNVMFQDAVQLAEKLIREGKPFEQAYYPAENHIFVRDETLVDAFRRASEFFDRNLK